MSLTLKPATPRTLKIATSPGGFGIKTISRAMRVTFISGPRLLLTSRLSVKSASMMILLCAPALLFCGMLTIPALIFPSPQQQAYFYFSQVLNHDPVRWIGLVLAGACALIALAVPASNLDTYKSVRY